jgi:hypothetical protein
LWADIHFTAAQAAQLIDMEIVMYNLWPLFWFLAFTGIALLSGAAVLYYHRDAPWAQRLLGPQTPAAVPAAGAPVAVSYLLSLSSIWNLTLVAVGDLVVVSVVMFIVGTAARIPLEIQFALVFFISVALFLWQSNLFRNHVDTFEKAVVTFLDEIVPSGPDGQGLSRGYYAFWVGPPFWKMEFPTDTRRVPVPFKQMQVWLQNSLDGASTSTAGFSNTQKREHDAKKRGSKGSVEGEITGVALYRVVNPSQSNATKELEAIVLPNLTEESARDVAEGLTDKQFLAKENDVLGNFIWIDITAKLAKFDPPLGVVCDGVIVSKTDVKDPSVRNAWAQVSAQDAMRIALETANDGLVSRTDKLKNSGVDADRAPVVDLVNQGKAGATVSNNKSEFDIGKSTKDVVQGALGALANVIDNRTNSRPAARRKRSAGKRR